MFPDDVPVADAVGQRRPTGDVPPHDDLDSGVPLEAAVPDWREQREAVLIDPDLEAPSTRAAAHGYRMISPG